MWQFADLRFAGHLFFVICGSAICDKIIFGGFKTSANPEIHNFSPYKYKLKMHSFKFKDDFWLLEQFRDMAFRSLNVLM